MGTFTTIALERRDDVAYVTLASPPLNIMTAAMMDEISQALEDIADDAQLKAVAFQADGKAFSAGADVGEHRPQQAPEMIRAFSTMFEHFGRLELPIVMAVDGAALGGGFELTMMADILLATPGASFGQPEIRLGFFAPVGVSILPRLIGDRRAMEITCSGRSYTAAEMQEFGLVSRVVEEGRLEAALEDVLKDFRRTSALIMRMNVRMIRQLGDLPREDARRKAERVFLEDLMATEDVQEGIASFFEKRRPDWKNR